MSLDMHPKCSVKETAGRNEADVDVSLIVPAYNEAENIIPFYQATVAAFSDFDGVYELVFIDDGSADDSYKKMAEIASIENRPCKVTVISFSRNFGKEAAMYAGLQHASGKVLGFIDSDLQQRPSTFREMYDLLMSEEEYDCVAAYQEQRNAGRLRNLFSTKFYGLLAKSSNMEVMPNASDFRVFRRYVADAILSMGERHRFSKGIFAWVGFKTLPFAYTPDDRNAGETSWSFSKLVRYALGGLLAFSTSPLTTAIYLGIACSIVAVVYLVFVVLQRLIWGVDVPGYATIVVLQLLFGGLQLLVLGMLGSYIARDYIEDKQRPIYIARRIIRDESYERPEKTG